MKIIFVILVVLIGIGFFAMAGDRFSDIPKAVPIIIGAILLYGAFKVMSS